MSPVFRRPVVFALALVAIAACQGVGETPPTALRSGRVPSGISGTNLYVANSGGKTGAGAVTVYGLERGKLLGTITQNVDRPSDVGYDSVRQLIAVANTEPVKGHGSGSVALYTPGSNTPTNVLRETADPVSLAFDTYGKVYVANYQAGVNVYEPYSSRPSLVIPSEYSGFSCGVYQPKLVAVDAAGNVYVADGPMAIGSQERIYELAIFAPGQVCSYGGVEIGPPRALLVSNNVVYIACAFPKSDRRNPYGFVEVLKVGSSPRKITRGIYTPDGLAVDSSDNLYVANLNGHDVSVYPPGADKPGRVITAGVHSPKALAIGPLGNLYVSNLYDDTVSVYKPGRSTPFVTIKQSIDTPVSVAIDGVAQ